MPIVAPTPAPNIPTPVPTTADPATFDARADATLSALPPAVAGVNAIGANVYANAQEVVTQAGIATSKAQIATDQAQAASDSNTGAGQKAQIATDAASAANTRANDANTSAQNADTARQLAQDWASKPSGTVGTSGLKSSLQYAADAKASADSAAGAVVGVLTPVRISANTAGVLGNLYIFTGPCRLTLPVTTDTTKKISWCNASQDASGCSVDFGTAKLKGFPTSPGVMTLDSTTHAATVQWSGDSTTGWAQA